LVKSALAAIAQPNSLNDFVAKGADCFSHLKWDSFGLGFGVDFKQWLWLEIGRCLATVDCQNFGSIIDIGDVPIGSLDQDWLHNAKCLEDAPTFNSHFQLFGKVEWVWLKSGLKAVNETFQNPAFASGAFFESGECRDE